MTEVEQTSQNGIELMVEEDANNKARPADIEQDMREMERRKRVEAIMGSKLFREELERIVDSQIREGGSSGILQQLSDIVGIPTSRVGSGFKSSNCVLPINDIRGIEAMGYSKGEKILRCKLGATFRLLDIYGWTKGLGAQITARLKVDQELFLVNPFGLLFHEVTASSLNKVDMQGNVVEQGTTNFGVNKNHFILHSVVHAARPDIRCAIYIGCNSVVAVSSLRVSLLPLTYDSVVLGEISSHPYTGYLSDAEEREKLVRSLGPVSKVLLLTNYGALCCGETIEEAFFAAHHIVQACETQLKVLPMGIENLVMIPEESRKAIYDAARRPPEDIIAAFEKKTALISATSEDVSTADESQVENNKDTSQKLLQQPKWRVGGAEFEALMRMLDNAGFRTGYIYRHPLIKSELPKPRNDVELPPAVSSLGYLLEEEELYRQGIWKKGEWRKGGDRSRWLNSPNVYQKVEVLETGTPDPKKITKWVAEGSPTHSTPVKIEGALQFVPTGTNSKEFKKVQQQIKDNRRADKISAGPQSHILEGVTWDEANRIKDATVSSAGDHVVLMGAASKGIIQRGFQHNATVYKAPYAKNPFDNVTDDELNEYKRTVEKKKNIHGEYTDTDFSESEALSSVQASGAQKQSSMKAAVLSQSENEEASEHQVMSIETKQAPVPSQPEVVLSDAQENQIIFNLNKSSIQMAQFNTATQKKDLPLKMCSILNNSYHHHSYSLKQQKICPLKLYVSSSETLPVDENVLACEKVSLKNGILYNVTNCKVPLEFQTPLNKIFNDNIKPYRTYSHFGYNNCKQFQSTPKHYHIPISSSKYTPIKKARSYNEVFSSTRYFDFCDTCFEKISRIGPDFFFAVGSSSKNHHTESLKKVSLDYNNIDFFTDFNCKKGKLNLQNASEKSSNDSTVLESVQEVNEDDHSQSFKSTIDFREDIENLDFWDKITRMNYSDESTNLCYDFSNTISSNISIKQNINNLTNDLSTPSIETTKVNISQAEKALFYNLNKIKLQRMESKKSNNDSRKLMSREERYQRKQEFSELWEDHVEYYSPRWSSDPEIFKHNEFEIYIGEIIIKSLECFDSKNKFPSTNITPFNISSILTIDQEDVKQDHNPEFHCYSDEVRLVSDSIEKAEVNDLKNQNTFERNIQPQKTPLNCKTAVLKQQEKNNNLKAKTLTSENFNFKEKKNLNVFEMKRDEYVNNLQVKSKKLRPLENISILQNGCFQHVTPSRNIYSTDKNNMIITSPSVYRIKQNRTSNKIFKLRKHSLSVSSDEYQGAQTPAKRNFIAENIQKASIPRRKNTTASLSKLPGASTSSPQLIYPNAIPSVYSFQTKMVGESQRFWVSLSPMDGEKQSSSIKSQQANSQIRADNEDVQQN